MIYLPLRYTAEAKYQDSKLWLADQLLLVDVMIAILATSLDGPGVTTRAISIPFFVLSFMCVYEIGYFENDLKAAPKESAPVISEAVSRFASYRIEPDAWIWAVLMAGIGFLLAYLCGSLSTKELGLYATVWALILLAVRGIFSVYNRMPVQRRPYIYTVLQTLKYCSIPTIFDPSFLGSLLIASQVLTVSVVYWVYRVGGANKAINREAMRVVIAASLASPFALNGHVFQTTFSGALICVIWLLLRLLKPPVMSAVRKYQDEVPGQ